MKEISLISKYVLYDLLRSKFIIALAILLFSMSAVFFYMDANVSKTLLSLLNIVLLLIPLVTTVFTTIHFYNSREFMEMLLSQPISRRSLFFAQWISVSLSLCIAFLAGVGSAIIIWAPQPIFIWLIICGIFLILVFTSVSFLISAMLADKTHGMGATLLTWFFFSVIYDGLVLMLLFAFSDYPLEKPVLILTALNPIDLARLLLLLKLDNAAIMGYTGTIFQDFLGTNKGIIICILILVVWLIVPLQIAWRKFYRKDF